jgi:hypothetical protein
MHQPVAGAWRSEVIEILAEFGTSRHVAMRVIRQIEQRKAKQQGDRPPSIQLLYELAIREAFGLSRSTYNDWLENQIIKNSQPTGKGGKRIIHFNALKLLLRPGTTEI